MALRLQQQALPGASAAARSSVLGVRGRLHRGIRTQASPTVPRVHCRMRTPAPRRDRLLLKQLSGGSVVALPATVRVASPDTAACRWSDGLFLCHLESLTSKSDINQNCTY